MKRLALTLLLFFASTTVANALDIRAYYGLTGGGAGALDKTAVADLSNGDLAMVLDTSGNDVYFYKFVSAATDAESSPDYIRPDDYSTSGVWYLIDLAIEGIPDLSGSYETADTDIVKKNEAESITGVWETQDDTNECIGNDADMCRQWETDLSGVEDFTLTGGGLLFSGTNAGADIKVVLNNTNGTYGVDLYVKDIHYTGSLQFDGSGDSKIELSNNASYVGNAYELYYEGGALITVESGDVEKEVMNTTDHGYDSINIFLDGGGSALADGTKICVEVSFAATITESRLLADQSGSVVVDWWVDSYANWPPTNADSITSSATPTISTATKDSDTTLTGWTTSITAEDILCAVVEGAATSIESVTAVLKIQR